MLKGKLFLNNEWILARLSGKVFYKTEKITKGRGDSEEFTPLTIL